jgi:hypothetical protein
MMPNTPETGQTIGVYFPTWFAQKLKQDASKQGKDMSSYIRHIVVEYYKIKGLELK